jgi:hypothetical protein
MARIRRPRPEWYEHDSIRALFALERVWVGQATRARAGTVRVWMLPDARCAQDEHEPPVVTLSRAKDGWHGALRAEWDCLPFSDASVAQLVVQHVLDDASRASSLLAECARVLSLDGELLLFGLNPAGVRACAWASARAGPSASGCRGACAPSWALGPGGRGSRSVSAVASSTPSRRHAGGSAPPTCCARASVSPR